MATEQEVRDKIQQHDYTIYLDECGAGPLCADLVICGLVLPKEHGITGLNDSKKISEKKRELLFPLILEKATDYCIIKMTPHEVDTLNIFQARMEGFRRAIAGITKVEATYAVIDGNKVPPGLGIETDYLIKADALIEGVSAASIVAKVTRDRELVELSKQEPYSKYGLDKHKGYGTALHMAAIKEHGYIEGFHRLSFSPIKEMVQIKKPKI